MMAIWFRWVVSNMKRIRSVCIAMHGNVAEWTRSDYLPYPYNEKSKEVSEYKVVRGGSYIERPKFSTAYTRKGYYPYQRVFNVGFRVIIED